MEHGRIMKCLEVDEQICSIVSILIIYFEVRFSFEVLLFYYFISLGFFPFWSIVLVGLALIFLTIAIVGLIGFFLGCRRPTPEELRAAEYGAPTPDDEFLLGTGESPDVIDGKTPTNGYYNNYNQRDFRYESSPRGQKTRIGQSDEDMV